MRYFILIAVVVHACPSAFWKTVDRLFASVGAEEKSYLLEQVTTNDDFDCTTELSAFV